MQADILDLPAQLDTAFDLVFTSWGVLAWLPDLTAWGQGVERCLRPSGGLLVVEFHPFVWTLDGELRVEYGYFPTGTPVLDEVHGSYADPDAVVHNTVCYSWTHSFDEIIIDFGTTAGYGYS